MPPEGLPKPASYGPNTPGSQRLINVGKEVGINFTYKCPVFPNTLMAHCALEYALEEDPSGKIQNDLQEKLFNSYFTDGESPSTEVVSKLASQCGLAEDRVKSFIEKKENQEKVQLKATQSAQDGISGVPFFIINGQGMISGAQEAVTLAKAFEVANKKFPTVDNYDKVMPLVTK